VLWTRADPRVGTPSTITWQVASDAAFTTIVSGGTATVDPNHDYCVKVLVGGLSADRSYWYRFTSGSHTSAVGRARTLPAANAPSQRLNLAMASCQHFSAGFYGAWKAVSTWDIDAVLFLGDYIYERSASVLGVRGERETNDETLGDYRGQYRLYRSDPWLQAAHAAHPFITIWDDHEVINDYDATFLFDNPAKGSAAYQAWFEYQPVWPINGTQIYRTLRWGNLAEIPLIDSRQYRDAHTEEYTAIGGFLTTKLASPTRSMLGAAQRQYLLDAVDAAQADGVTWKVLGNPVMMGPLRIVDLDTPANRALDPNLIRHAGFYTNEDGWDGFSAERDILLAHWHTTGVQNLTILTGDYHAFFKQSVKVDFDAADSPVIANEYVVSSISSITFNLAEQLSYNANGSVSADPSLDYSNVFQNGVGLVEITPANQRVTFYSHTARNGTVLNPEVPRPMIRWTQTAGSTAAVQQML
jgi:alkaline phosphatase D